MSLSPEREQKYAAMISAINAMSDDELVKLVASDACPFEPEHLIGVPLGMFHCLVCGEMVIAGLPHPRKRDKQSAEQCEALPPGGESEVAPV